MKILCVSVHPVLEFDEIKLFESMGHQVFSLGFFFNRNKPDNLRPPLAETDWHRECRREFIEAGCSNISGNVQWSVVARFSNLFDIIVVHHNYHFIASNWDQISSVPVVWRTIGQELHWAENAMRPYRDRGVKIVRWSPEERFIGSYIGEDAVIRSAKEPSDWKGWTGDVGRILTFNNNFRARGNGMCFDFHQSCVEGLPFDLYGLDNGDVPRWRGVVAPDEQQGLLRNHRVAFITGTFPAPYTLGFIEAWMTGIPVVHVGRRRFAGDQRGMYEIDHLIKNGESGFLVDEVEEAHEIFDKLLNDLDLCRYISANGRAAAIQYFGWEQAQVKWDSFFKDCLS